MSATISTETPAPFNLAELIIFELGRLPTFDEAREFGMQCASLAATLNVAASYQKSPEIPPAWVSALDEYTATIDSLRFAQGGPMNA